jgi:hypothetical protein
MLHEEFDEQLQALTKQVEELRADVQLLKEKREEEVTLIPGAEYDLVPSLKPKVIGTFVMRVGKIYEASSLLGLTDEEWRLYSTPDDQ